LRYSRPSQFGSTNRIFNGRLTRFALLADAACCRCSARRSSDHPLKAPIIMRLVDFRRPDTLAMACSTQKSNGFY
jgi:hypothetical protein